MAVDIETKRAANREHQRVHRARKRIEDLKAKVATVESEVTELREKVRSYVHAERVASIDEALERIRSMWLTSDLRPMDTRNLAVAHAVMIDKRRLEEGEVTNLTAHVSPADAHKAIEMRDRARAEAARLLGDGDQMPPESGPES